MATLYNPDIIKRGLTFAIDPKNKKGYSPTISPTGIGTSNDLHIRAMTPVAAGASSYVNYSKNQIANMKMYNKALTAAEINQNYHAFRGRFGL